MENPKSEGRNPKEVRNPKAERLGARAWNPSKSLAVDFRQKAYIILS